MSESKISQRENVRVVCRVRPINSLEKAKGKECVQLTANSIQVNAPDAAAGPFFFDRVFAPESTQREIFEDTTSPLIQDVLFGYNATVFAYGQSGSGKTHTMEGAKDPSQLGIIPRSASALFAGVNTADENIEFMISASYVEIYMERIRDLLDDLGVNTNLQVREDPVRGIYIEGATEEYVGSAEMLLEIMVKGGKNRAVAATGLNEGSSRSHSLFTVHVSQRDLKNNSTTTGKLVLVDLAGSETNRKTNATGQQLEEAKTINKSLSALGLVINALTDAKSTHVPYRDSKLTRVLQDSLGGNSKTVLIIACSPSSFNAQETVSTIRFGQRAKSITNKIVVNKTRSVEELEALLARTEKAMDAMADKIASLTTELQVAQVSGGKGGGGALTGEESGETVALLAKLQGIASERESALENEQEESARKDEEIASLKELLIAKEKILVESDQLMQEAQMHIEEKRISTDRITKEKLELAARLEEVQGKMESELRKSNFAVKELNVTVESLKNQNSELQRDLREYMGEKRLETSTVNSDKESVAEGRYSVKNSEANDLNVRGDLSKGLRNIQERLVLQKSDIEQWKRSVLKGADAGAKIESLLDDRNTWEMQRVDEVLTWAASFQKALDDQEKKYKELFTQRDQLQSDLSVVTTKASKVQGELDAVQRMSGEAAARFFDDKSKVQLKSLQHRLEQLVAVHRQLLRKFSSLDIENNDLKKKIYLRDDRIDNLESAARTAASTLRTQTEGHINELNILKDQIQNLRDAEIAKRDFMSPNAMGGGGRVVLRGGAGAGLGLGNMRSHALRGGGHDDYSNSSNMLSSPNKKKSFFSKIMGGGGQG